MLMILILFLYHNKINEEIKLESTHVLLGSSMEIKSIYNQSMFAILSSSILLSQDNLDFTFFVLVITKSMQALL